MSAGTWRWPDRLPFGPIGLFLLTAAVYAGGARLALLLIEASQLWSVFFVPAGVMAGFLLRVRPRNWWAIVLAAGTTEALLDLDFGYTPLATAGFVAGNLAGPVVGALVVRRRCGVVDLARLRHVGWFLTGSVVLGPGVAALVGSLVADAAGEGQFGTQVWQWWLGDALGVILIGSFILVWGSSPDRRSLRSVAGAVLLLGTLLITVWVLTMTHLPLVFLVLLGVVMAGVVFGARGAASAALVIALAKAVDIAFLDGANVVGLTEAEALMVIQLRLGVFTIAGLVVAALVNEREAANSRAHEARILAREAETARRVEHDIAEYLQEGLLPDEPIQHPDFQVAARYAAGGEAVVVGGDWYDVMTVADGRIGIILGDVGGHGLEATTQMGRLRTATAALALHAHDPAALIASVDEYAQGRHTVGFATLGCAFLDPRTGLLSYASAGHPPMLVVAPDGETVWLDEATTPPLHGGREMIRAQAWTTIVPGSLLIGYTDGLVENLSRDIGEGLTRLEAVAKEVAHRPVADICMALLLAMGVASNRRDDVVIVALRYEPQVTDQESREILIRVERDPLESPAASPTHP